MSAFSSHPGVGWMPNVSLGSVPSMSNADFDFTGFSGSYNPQTLPLSGGSSSGLGSSFLGSAVGALGNIASGIINNVGARKMAMLNYELGEKSADKAFQRQLDFWNKQNEYNTPAAQAARMREAGLSPVESVASTPAGSLSSISSGQGQGSAAWQRVELDLMPAIEAAARISQMDFGNSKTAAETKVILADLPLKALESQLRSAGLKREAESLRGIRIRNNKDAVDLRYADDLNAMSLALQSLDYDTRAKLLEGVRSDVNLKLLQNDLLLRHPDFTRYLGAALPLLQALSGGTSFLNAVFSESNKGRKSNKS